MAFFYSSLDIVDVKIQPAVVIQNLEMKMSKRVLWELYAIKESIKSGKERSKTNLFFFSNSSKC